MVELNIHVLSQVAGTIEALLLEKQESIAWAAQKVPGLKISLSVQFDQTAKGLEINYTISFPLQSKPEAPAKERAEKKEIISDTQALFGSVTITSGDKSVTINNKDL